MKGLLFIFSLILLLTTPVFWVSAATPIKILLVPGHDDVVWGAQYGNVKEADMNLRLATKIYNILKKDKRFEVYITRDSKGYTKKFADYFSEHQDEIVAFRENAKKKMQAKISDGSFIEKENPPHNDASENMSVRLYGINKWANENKMDAVIHVHFNDYPRPDKWTVGKYKGFAIYMPEEQMANAKASSKLAGKIFTQLKKKYATSTYPPEKGGLVEDQSLIALGSNGTLLSTVRSILIEYGYIYRFKAKNLESNYTNMAKLTTAGIKNHFFPK